MNGLYEDCVTPIVNSPQQKPMVIGFRYAAGFTLTGSLLGPSPVVKGNITRVLTICLTLRTTVC